MFTSRGVRRTRSATFGHVVMAIGVFDDEDEFVAAEVCQEMAGLVGEPA